MNFYDKITEMGYELSKKTETEILITKKEEIADTVIYFDTVQKQISGAIKTNKLLYTVDDIAKHYKIFREMREDLTVLQQLSKYDIIS